jgi:hypothetical protein
MWQDDMWNGHGKIQRQLFCAHLDILPPSLLLCEGEYTWENGDRYVGSWKDMKRHGIGRLMLASGNTYEGEFRDDEMTGVGVYTWKNGAKYSGEFVNGVSRRVGKSSLCVCVCVFF